MIFIDDQNNILFFIGDSALGSMYLLMKFWMISSESLKSELWLLLAWRWTELRVYSKSASHHTYLFKSKSYYKYLDDPKDIRSAWRAP